MQKTIWGFDIGTTSIGFAVLKHDEQRNEGEIVWMGSRIFPEGVTEKEREPRNKKRRDARMMRRQNRRKKLRRRLIEELLQEKEMLPAFDSREWRSITGADPWSLRVRALTEKLDPMELGRAIYHLLKRRGFKSSRLETNEEKKKESGEIAKEIGALAEKMEGRTLSQTLAEEPKKRNRHTGRDMVEDEFNRLWDAQKKHHPSLLTDDFKNALYQIGFTQRPVFWRTATLGTCRLEPDSPVCLKASWEGQQYTALQKLNSLRLTTGNNRPLRDEEREIVYNLLMDQQSVTFGGIRKALKKIWQEQDENIQQKFNFEVGGDKSLPGNVMEARLRKIFGKDWPEHALKDKIRDELAHRLRVVDYGEIGKKKIVIRNNPAQIEDERQKFVRYAKEHWQATDEQAEALSNIELPPGWLSHSAKAVRKMLPYLEEGRLYSSKDPENMGAMQLAYPDFRDDEQEALARLPSHPRKMPDLRNPTVNRALNELRKVANNLIGAFGKPDLIRIELARDLKLSGKKLAEVNKKLREREAERKKAKEDFADHKIENPSGSDIEKWLLWKECKEYCPYTGNKIGWDELFGSNVKYQIEHIFPLGRSLDNTFANKTLCHVDVNREKGNKTPFEYFGPEKIKEVAQRIYGVLPDNKVRRFIKDDFLEIGDAEYDERQLRDTAYIATEARKFLQRLFGNAPEDMTKVETCNGRVTFMLRRFWGLNTILGDTGEKNRADHRHHAVDAVAIAMTTRAFVKRLSDAFSPERRPDEKQFPAPWPNFRHDVEDRTGQIVVSHKVMKKVSGPLHEETSLGDTGFSHPDNPKLRRYVKRKAVKDLTPGDIKAIRDEGIKRLIVAHVCDQKLDPEKAGDLKKAFAKQVTMVSKNGEVVPVNRVRIFVDQQPHLMVQRNARTKAYADPGDNHHMAIYRGGNGKIDFEVVPLFEAARRLANKEPVIRKTSSTGAKLVMSLASGDMLCFNAENSEKAYRYVSSVWAAGRVVLHNQTRTRDDVWKRPTINSLLGENVLKVSVDPIGRVRPTND